MISHYIKVPTLDIKLSGGATYPEWVVSVQIYLSLVPAGDNRFRLSDVVTGDYAKPASPASKGSSRQAEADSKALQTLLDANNIALLTMRKNCDDEVRARIGNLTSAKDAYNELKKAYEGKMTTEFYALLGSLTSFTYDDRKTSIEEHVTQYERIWNSFVRVISRADTTNDDGFEKGLNEFAKSSKAKAEFLLESLPPFYSNTVENIRSKDNYEYDFVARKLKEYVPLRQKERKRRGTKEAKRTQWC